MQLHFGNFEAEMEGRENGLTGNIYKKKLDFIKSVWVSYS
jgi:hypothetical protein